VSDKRRSAPALFDPAAFAEDLDRLGGRGRRTALAARKDYEAAGVPIAHLLACAEEGPDGTALPGCMKVYLPRPLGDFGMVFRIERREGRGVLLYIAFGVRHHPRGSNAPSVYRLAHRRLNG
jgi:hypothetical protein